MDDDRPPLPDNTKIHVTYTDKLFAASTRTNHTVWSLNVVPLVPDIDSHRTDAMPPPKSGSLLSRNISLHFYQTLPDIQDMPHAL